MKEIVMDTNVLVSALLTPRGTPRKILSKIAEGKIGWVISPRLLLEAVSVFSRPKFRLLIPESRISDLVTLIHPSARIVKPEIKLHACRDPKDNAVLECAVAGKVLFLLTGDGDLLVLNPFRSISIITPSAFLSSFRS